MTTDSVPLPSQRELERHLHEISLARNLLIAAVALLALGTVGIVGLGVAAWANPGMEPVRRILNGVPLVCFVAGFVMLGTRIQTCAQRRRHESVMYELAKLRRRLPEPGRPWPRINGHGEPNVVDMEDIRLLKRIDGKIRDSKDDQA